MKPVKNKYEKRMLKLENQRRANPCMKANKTNAKARFGSVRLNLDLLRSYDADISKPVLRLCQKIAFVYYLTSLGMTDIQLYLETLHFNSKGEMSILKRTFFGTSIKQIIIPEDDIIKVKLRNRGLWKKIIIKTKKKRYSFITVPKTLIPLEPYSVTRQEWPYFVRYMKDIMKRRKHQ